MRVGPPQFGPRLGAPMFMRGGNRPGPSHPGPPAQGKFPNIHNFA